MGTKNVDGNDKYQIQNKSSLSGEERREQNQRGHPGLQFQL